MQIHNLRPLRHKRKKIKHIGRGGKRGTTSGRGQKGQKSRAGHKIRPNIREIVARLPKIRGIKHKSLVEKPRIVKTGDLDKKFSGLKSISKKTFLEKGIIKSLSEAVKILDGGEVKTAFNIAPDIWLSQKAKARIEKAGGRTGLTLSKQK